MDRHKWVVKSFVVPASHIRGYSRGVRNEKKDHLRLAVKQYVPRSDSQPSEKASTIIFCHGVGSTKESYEPFFANLLDTGLDIRAVWAADIAWHGASYRLNESTIGDSPHWDDAARDILHVINTFQDLMPPPIIGIGQSWGAYPIIQCSLFHPRLFTAIVALEPNLMVSSKNTLEAANMVGHTAVAMAKRKDRWSSREEAKRVLRTGAYYGKFDDNVWERVAKYDLVNESQKDSEPYAITSEKHNEGPVVLTTPKAMEVATMMRMNPDKDGKATDDNPNGNSEYDPTGSQHVLPGFFRPEPSIIQNRLPDVRPPVLYVFGTDSAFAHSQGYREALLEPTGTAKGGNGGLKKSRVAEAWVKGAGHPMPLEKPRETAVAMVPWLEKQIQEWSNETRAEKGKFWTKAIDPVWMEKISKL